MKSCAKWLKNPDNGARLHETLFGSRPCRVRFIYFFPVRAPGVIMIARYETGNRKIIVSARRDKPSGPKKPILKGR